MTLKAKDIEILFDANHEIKVKEQPITVNVNICKVKEKLEMMIVAKRQTSRGLLFQDNFDYKQTRILHKNRQLNDKVLQDYIEQAKSAKFIDGMKSFLTAHYEARI